MKRRLSLIISSLLAFLPLWLADCQSLLAQDAAMKSRMDSTVIEYPDGSSLVTYSYAPFDFGTVRRPSDMEKKPLVASDSEKNARIDNLLSELRSKTMPIPRRSSTSDNSYAVGEIPLIDGMTPSGGRTYQIPITTAAGFNLVPSVSIGYNSQAGEGWVGYGWDIQGISSITLISRNVYYHGIPKGAIDIAQSAVFALDGVPLVTNTQTATAAAYPLVTASGNILASPVYNAQGYVSQFNVLYPDGKVALFGIGANAAHNMPNYPISQLTDRNGNRVSYIYSYDLENGNDRLTSIRYGYTSSGQYIGEITFSYATSSGYNTRYFAGRSVYRNQRLTGITSKDGNSTICQYSFSYEQKDNVYLMNRVECTSSGSSLRPLTFEYGTPGYPTSSESGQLNGQNRLLLSSAFTEDAEFVYRRGKFVSRSYNDGLLIYPYFPPYFATAHKKLFTTRYEFNSGYPENQEILFTPSLSDYSEVNTSITTESGFQTIEAVDVDGDGLDELVKVNFNGTSGSNTILKITVYKANSSGIPILSSHFNVQVKGTITSGDYVSPYKREYYWGDFRGNGKVQLLTIAFDKNYNEKKDFDQTSYTTLIDISSHEKLYDSWLFDFTDNEKECVLVCDLDNDGQTELCHATAAGLNVFRFQTTNAFSLEHIYGSVTKSVLSNPHIVTDINGDGYIDIMFPPQVNGTNYWNRYAFTGNGFASSTMPILYRSAGDEYTFMDINQDGCQDLVKVNGTNMGFYLNNNGNSFSTYHASSSVTNAKGIVPCNVVDYCGMSSFIKIDGFFVREYSYSAPSPLLRHLTTSTDSYGKVISNTYEYLPSWSRYWTDSSASVDNVNGFAFRTLPIYVLYQEQAFVPNSSFLVTNRNRTFYYYDGVVHNTGLGFCGFSRIRTYDQTGDVTRITDEIHDSMKRGLVTRVENRTGSPYRQPYLSVENTYDNNSTTYGKLNPRLIGSQTTDALTGITTTTSYTYDSYDYPTSVSTGRRIGNGVDQTERLTTTYQHSSSPSMYVLGVVTEQSSLRETDGSSGLSWKERTVNTYDSRLRPVSSKHYVGRYGFERHDSFDTPRANLSSLTAVGQGTEDIRSSAPVLSRLDATNLVSETQWQYDSYGNAISEKTAAYGSTEFVGNTYTYDSNGRFMLSDTDALGHVTSYSGYTKFGQPTTVSDYRNRATTYTYDSWGNLTGSTHQDGAVENISLAWGGKGLYTVTETETGKPDKVVHYDALGREVRTGEKRFDGQWQLVDREYDSAGNLSRASLPFRGSSATYWNTYSYDDYNRPLSLTEASGKVSTWSYSGTSVTSMVDGITSTSTTDANGNVISVSDPGGTITYTLRDDGQPSSITAPGNVVTSFSYDEYGRRTSISDPSAGVQTESYVWNSDGSSEMTSTNPNGSIITHRDKYGRTTLVERSGEYNTTYTYNTYGLVSSEQSTNGTGKTYTYDAFDRVTAIRENVPDGKWLQRAISYGPGSNVSSIAYSSQGGSITTETYTYTNGHNTGITIPGGTVVWNLTSENDLGLTTGITSGTISREYGFTDFGIPTYRKMAGGSLQNFNYQFDSATGNLLSRTDAVNGRTETFGYDNLNRLTSIDNRQISYDDSGNITSIGGIGSMFYSSQDHPYQITSLTPVANGIVPNRQQTVTYTSYSRPSVLTEGGKTASFTYNGDGDRVKMQISDGTSQTLARYYIGGCYELDVNQNGTVERLYLGGDAYSAPMVYQKQGSGSWTAYNIGRDYLGSITHIASLNGTPVAEYSYDPWGRLRNPATLAIYASGSEPDLMFGRGFTGHEHMTWFGLINMNARLYDPLLGRFLSPDPYVQAPDFTQNFNRYSYALNNPLKYTDENGEFWNYIIGAVIGGISNWVANGCEFTWKGLGYFGTGAAIGALTSGASVLTTTAINACGVAAGVLTGAASGAISGAASGFLSNGLNNLVSGREFLDDAWNATRSGMISGALAGSLSGGLTGGKNALQSGKNIWWGNDVKFGRTQWSLNPVEKPYATVRFGLNDIAKNVNDCVPASFTEINDYFNGNISYDDFCSRLRYIKDKGVEGYASGLDIRSKALGFFSAAKIELMQLSDPSFAQNIKNNNNIITLMMKYNKTMNHMDNIRSISYYSTKVKVRLRIGSFSLNQLIQNTRWSLSVNGLRY